MKNTALFKMPGGFVVWPVFIAFMVLSACNGHDSTRLADNNTITRPDTAGTAGNERDRMDCLDDIKVYRRQTTSLLRQNDSIIVQLKEDARKQQLQQKAGFTPKLNDLETENNLLKKKIETYRFTQKTDWLAFKNEFNHSLDELAQNLDELQNWWN